MLNFCTLFDSNYLLLGLNMYESLRRNCDSFHLYVFAFDDTCYTALVDLNLEHLTVVSLKEFEDEELLRIKGTRGKGEYCWTCTPSTILYCIKEFNLNHCTYLDADLYFFSNPKVLVEEMGERSVLIISHRYTPRYDQSQTSGVYCVQFMTFKNDPNGLRVLKWWREACIDWCYARAEDGKFGDQKYLDTWPEQFEGIHELRHLGGGVAPWNVQQYQFKQTPNGIEGAVIKSGESFNLIFYHFHGLRLLKDQKVDLCEYQISNSVKKMIYKPYLREIEKTKAFLRPRGFPINLDFNFQPKSPIKRSISNLRRMMKKEYHIYKLAELI